MDTAKISEVSKKLANELYHKVNGMFDGPEVVVVLDTTICRLISAISTAESISNGCPDDWEEITLNRVNRHYEIACQMTAHNREHHGAEPYLTQVAPHLAASSNAKSLLADANAAHHTRGLHGVVDVLRKYGCVRAAEALSRRFLAGR